MVEVGFGFMNLKFFKEEVLKCVDEVLEYMNILYLKDCLFYYLSGGEKKCVSIVDIIVMKLEIIIFDELIVVLDFLNVMMLEEVLMKFGFEGKIMFIFIYDVDFIYRWVERVFVFSEGKIIVDGIFLEIFKNKEILK